MNEEEENEKEVEEEETVKEEEEVEEKEMEKNVDKEMKYHYLNNFLRNFPPKFFVLGSYFVSYLFYFKKMKS